MGHLGKGQGPQAAHHWSANSAIRQVWASKQRRSGCNTVPKDITGVLSALSSVQVDNKIAVHSYKNSKNSVQYPNNAQFMVLLGPV